MTDLAHECALLGIPADPWKLYRQDDPFYEVWLTHLVGRVTDTKREMAKHRG